MRSLDRLPSERRFGQVRFADRGLGDRLLAVGCTDAIERAMGCAHVAARLMTGQRNLLGMGADRVGEKLHLFDWALQRRFAEPKTNELENQHRVERW